MSRVSCNCPGGCKTGHCPCVRDGKKCKLACGCTRCQNQRSTSRSTSKKKVSCVACVAGCVDGRCPCVREEKKCNSSCGCSYCENTSSRKKYASNNYSSSSYSYASSSESPSASVITYPQNPSCPNTRISAHSCNEYCWKTYPRQSNPPYQATSPAQYYTSPTTSNQTKPSVYQSSNQYNSPSNHNTAQSPTNHQFNSSQYYSAAPSQTTATSSSYGQNYSSQTTANRTSSPSTGPSMSSLREEIERLEAEQRELDERQRRMDEAQKREEEELRELLKRKMALEAENKRKLEQIQQRQALTMSSPASTASSAATQSPPKPSYEEALIAADKYSSVERVLSYIKGVYPPRGVAMPTNFKEAVLAYHPDKQSHLNDAKWTIFCQRLMQILIKTNKWDSQK